MSHFKRFFGFGLIVLVVVLLASNGSSQAEAHPADEICGANSKLDPALCKALAAVAAGDAVQNEPSRPVLETIRVYVGQGFLHILPKGTDHILFVLALFLASIRFKPLLLQISIFTLAHTITLALAALGKVSAPAAIVEPLIAISIAFVAIENLFFKDINKWRGLVVFGFGLFHGLGFAGVLSDLGLPQDQFLVSLISFNLGVEAGQISVILLAWGMLHWFYKRPWFRARIAMPLSFVIAAIGIFWALQRVFL